MTNRFKLIDDTTDMLIGHSTEVSGFARDLEATPDFFSCEITLAGLKLAVSFITFSLASKAPLNGFHIHFLDQEEKSIGAYFFTLDEPFYVHKTAGKLAQRMDLKLRGGSESGPSREAMEVWALWRSSKPQQRNAWAALSSRQRLGWMEVVRIHSGFMKNIQRDDSDRHYELDLSGVSDMVSFYCALGEAMNGPGGYYGFNLESLKDCLCGGFGAVPPFSLYTVNGSLLTLNNRLVEQDRIALKRLEDLLYTYHITLRPYENNGFPL